ncbi:MAG: glutamate--tRNA ligase, partial [Calditrichia bacterium]|nr:glutamate--tRNA ligase [Calditrichia bacterium]
YVQSQRTELYRKHSDELLEKGFAYPCFCSEDTLKEMREQQKNNSETPMYDRRCRNIPAEEAKERMKTEAHVLRLKMPLEGETKFNDVIRGEIKIQNSQVDDQVLLKSDGFPTYHLANVIDDHYMEITHVIRGEEWLLSVPKHIKLYEMFGWELPEFAHLPLLLNPDRSKLSKRQGDVAVEDYLQKGYLPEALINFVALLGWNPGNDKEIFTIEELIESFKLNKVNKAGAVFDVDKLKWMNGQYIRKLSDEKLVEFMTPFVEKAGFDISDKQLVKQAILSVKNSVSAGSEIGNYISLFFEDELTIEEEEALQLIKTEEVKTVILALKEEIKNVDVVDLNAFKNIMKNVQNNTGIKGKGLWMSVRVAMTGMTQGPELPNIIEAFGKEKIEKFLNIVTEKYIS